MGNLFLTSHTMSDTPNGKSEPKDANTEGAEDKTAGQAKETEPKQEEGITKEDFMSELSKPDAPKEVDVAAKQSHEHNTLVASARINKLAREKEIDKTEAAIQLIDDGKIKQADANYLFKNDFGVREESPVSIDKDTIKSEMRAEEKLLSVVEAQNISKPDAKRLIEAYRELSKRNSPEEAADFALYRAGHTVKQAEDAAFRDGQNQIVKPKGSSPSTPEPKQVAQKISDMSLEEYKVREAEELQELQDLQDKGQA